MRPSPRGSRPSPNPAAARLASATAPRVHLGAVACRAPRYPDGGATASPSGACGSRAVRVRWEGQRRGAPRRDTTTLTEIYLVRHGTADRNSGVPYDIPPGPALLERGRFEAQQTAAWLSGRGLRHLYVSPFRRARETGEVIAELLGLPVTVHGGIAEHGPGEPTADLRARTAAFLELLDQVPEPAVALVSHGSPLWMLRAVLRGDPGDLPKGPSGEAPLLPAAVWHARRADAGWHVEEVFAPDEAAWIARGALL